MHPGPLSGKRILVLRADHQTEATVRAITSRGAVARVCPVIEIVDPPDPAAVDAALQGLTSYDWVLFTSANGVDRCAAALERLGLDRQAFSKARLAAIGPKTAERLHAHGLRADLVADTYVAEHLAAALLARADVHRVLLLRALVAREVLPERLRSAGMAVTVVPVYETRPVPASRARPLLDWLARRELDVVMFTSSSVVAALAGLLDAGARPLLEGLTAASIGPITTDTAAQLGIAVHVSASEHTVDGMLDALERHFRTAPSRS